MTAQGDLQANRDRQRIRAAAAIRAALAALEGWPLDTWEKVGLARAVTALAAGAYQLSLAEVALALTPKGERSPDARLPQPDLFDRCDEEYLLNAVERIEQAPAPLYPLFA